MYGYFVYLLNNDLTVYCGDDGSIISATKFDIDLKTHLNCTAFIRASEKWLDRIAEQRALDIKNKTENREVDDEL